MKLETMKCGGCGNDKMRLYAARMRGLDAFSCIEARCNCGTVTRWHILPAIVQDRSVEGKTDGSVCVGWKE